MRWLARWCCWGRPTPPPPGGFTSLPDDVMRHIAKKLDTTAAARLQATSRGVCAAVRDIVRQKYRQEAHKVGNAVLRDMLRALDAGHMLLAGYQLGPRIGSRGSLHRTTVPGFHITSYDYAREEHYLPVHLSTTPRKITGRGLLDLEARAYCRRSGIVFVYLTFRSGNCRAAFCVHVWENRVTRTHTLVKQCTVPGLHSAFESFERKLRRRVGDLA